MSGTSVGELFVNLGIKGADKTVGAISETSKGMSTLFSSSLETKAALVGVAYALERMFSASGKVGTDLTNFSALTGLSAKQLQQWEYAARQAGVANQEFDGSLKAVQQSMTNMLLGKGAPEGLQLVAQRVGFDPRKARDTFYVLEQLQKFARSAPPDVGNAVLKSFGLSDTVIAAMRRNAFNAQAFAQAPFYGDNQIKALDKANIAWSNLGVKIEMAFGKFNAKHGGQLVSDIGAITNSVMKLAEALTVLAEKTKVFAFLGKLAEGAASGFNLAGVAVDDFTGKHKGDDNAQLFGKDSWLGKLLDWRDKVDQQFFDAFKAAIHGDNSLNKDLLNSVTPTAPGGPTPKVEVKQDLHFQHDGKDSHKTSKSVKDANVAAWNDALRQFNQGQVS